MSEAPKRRQSCRCAYTCSMQNASGRDLVSGISLAGLRGLTGRVERAGRSWVCQVVGTHADPQCVWCCPSHGGATVVVGICMHTVVVDMLVGNSFCMILIGQACMSGIGQHSPGVGPAKHAEKT